ncbi:hypothetical protein NDU88_001091 [Pleurodeles waltl]|uniref:Uncharacterized protein n=1 Tax=Pleurodeles waltl TaxID=8319 RepID=A0AAV7VAW5_PLEWA|nr:hypothetical protein NDU88_001091 [Pleurodeles waltl]
MSNEPAYELNMPGQFLALNVLDRNMTEELEKELQKQCKNQNRTELPLLDGHQTLTKKLVLIPYRGYNHEIISLCTSRLTSSAGTSLWIDAIETSVFSNSEDVKILSLEFHVKQKIVMNVLSLPHYVIESRLSHQNSLKQKKRKETQKIKVALKASMGAAQNLKTETAVDPVARQQNGLVNMNEYLLIHSLETSIRCPTNRPFYERYHCLMPVLRCECLKPKPANQLSPNQIPTKTHYVAAPGLLQSNICSQNPSTQFYAAGSPLPIKSRVSLERNLESKRTNEKPSLRPTGCTDDGPQGQKQIRENNLNNISNIKQKRKNEDTVASLCKKNTLLQTVTSSFRIRLSKMWEEFQDTPITSGVQGIGPVLGRVLDSGNAASPDQNQEPLNDDTVPRANQEKKRKADMACIEPVQLSAMITAQSPSKYTSSRNRRMRNEKSNSSQNPMENI